MKALNLKQIAVSSKKPLQKFVSYFIKGLLLIIPLTITINFLSLGLTLFRNILGIQTIRSYAIFLVIPIALLGYIGSSVLVKSFFNCMEGLVTKVPFINRIYRSLKGFISSFSDQKNKFNQPVLITINKEIKMQEIGFIMQEELDDIDLPGSIAVFVPSAFGFSGKLVFVSKSAIDPLKLSKSDALTFAMSGGVLETFKTKKHR
jgi:uncharacterized membrane protein